MQVWCKSIGIVEWYLIAVVFEYVNQAKKPREKQETLMLGGRRKKEYILFAVVISSKQHLLKLHEDLWVLQFRLLQSTINVW